MSLIIKQKDGSITEISETSTIKVGDTELTKIYANGVLVWEKSSTPPPRTSVGVFYFSLGSYDRSFELRDSFQSYFTIRISEYSAIYTRIIDLGLPTDNANVIYSYMEEEFQSQSFPEIIFEGESDISELDIIFIICPVYNESFARAIYSFLNDQDFSGKQVYFASTIPNGPYATADLSAFQHACNKVITEFNLPTMEGGNFFSTTLSSADLSAELEMYLNQLLGG